MKVHICATEEQHLETPLPNPAFVEVETFADLLSLTEKYGDSVIVGTDKDGPWIHVYNGYIE